MITMNSLPAGFTVCDQIVLCSNTILGGSQLFLLGNTPPLLVGAGGQAPRIWLQAISDPDTKSFIPIVQDSRSIVGDYTVLKAVSLGESSVTVNEIDLRPLGLNVYGDHSGLKLGGMQLSNNTMSGVGVAFSLG
jgi:hypothetical protein